MSKEEANLRRVFGIVCLVIAAICLVLILNLDKFFDDEVENVNNEFENEEVIYPIAVTVDSLYSELNSNALRASENYKDEYIEVTGILASIDSDGKRFTLRGVNTNIFQSVLVSIPNDKRDEVKRDVMKYSEGDNITVVGKVKTVGETLGYIIDIEYIY